MQLTFRYTAEEFKASKRLNKLLGMPKWKGYGLAIVCLIPSLLLVWISGSTTSLIAFALIIVAIAILSILSAFRENPYLDKYDHVMTFSEASKYEELSHSEFETDWRNYDEFEETDTSFIFRKLERYALIPKRVIPADRLEEFRRYATKVNESPGESDLPVPLFDKLFSQPPEGSIFRFVYHPDDLSQALADPLIMVKENVHQVTSKKNTFATVWLLIFVALLLYFILEPPRQFPRIGSLNLLQFAAVIAAIVLPLPLIRGLGALLRSRAKQQHRSVPRDENRMRLMSTGWAIGTSESAIFYDWRDVECFYQNKYCIGFKTINDLIQIIPKRIFADASAAQAFLDQAIGLRREHRRKFEEGLVAVETGNPYQPPTI